MRNHQRFMSRKVTGRWISSGLTECISGPPKQITKSIQNTIIKGNVFEELLQEAPLKNVPKGKSSLYVNKTPKQALEISVRFPLQLLTQPLAVISKIFIQRHSQIVKSKQT